MSEIPPEVRDKLALLWLRRDEGVSETLALAILQEGESIPAAQARRIADFAIFVGEVTYTAARTNSDAPTP